MSFSQPRYSEIKCYSNFPTLLFCLVSSFQLTVVINDTHCWCADDSGEKIHTSQAEDRLFKYLLSCAELKIDDRAVGDDGEEPTERHHKKKEVKKVLPILVIFCHQERSTLGFLVQSRRNCLIWKCLKKLQDG